MMSKKSATLSNSEMTFYDNYVPSLKAGEYTITVSQKLTKDGSSPSIPSAPQAPVTQTFQVRGPRFTLDPADVHRMFPPPNGTGLYDVYLPMLVFNKRALPWERDLTLKSKVKDHNPLSVGRPPGVFGGGIAHSSTPFRQCEHRHQAGVRRIPLARPRFL